MWKPIILDVECIVCNKSLQKINHDPQDVKRKMGKIANRRSRTPNWSVEEKQFLLDLIKERSVVITRTTNGPNHYEEKDVAWNEILREFAKRFGNKFNGSSIKKVKTQWQNMKRIARMEISLNGPDIQKYSKQSLQVCDILDLMKDGVPKNEGQDMQLNETATSDVPNIEIKTERMDEEMNQPSCSTNDFTEEPPPPPPPPEETAQCESNSQDSERREESQLVNHFESSSTSSEHNSDGQEYEPQEQEMGNAKDASASTDKSCSEDTNANNVTMHSTPFQREFQEFFRYTAAEKQIKLESLKEERQVIKAMRETAELNKIIAEQRLKHVLWVKNREMAKNSR